MMGWPRITQSFALIDGGNPGTISSELGEPARGVAIARVTVVSESGSHRAGVSFSQNSNGPGPASIDTTRSGWPALLTLKAFQRPIKAPDLKNGPLSSQGSSTCRCW